jgi:hypothetical protein
MRQPSLRLLAVCAAVLVGALALGAGDAGAAGGGSLVFDVSVSAVEATFTNTGGSTLTHVMLNVDLGGATFDPSGSSSGCAGTGSGAVCALGNVHAGGVVITKIGFVDDASTGLSGTATWTAASVGNPQGAAAAKDVAVLGAFASGCNSATYSGETISISDSSSCSSAVEGIASDPNGGNDVYFVKGIPAGKQVTVELTFPDEFLPVPVYEGSFPGPRDTDGQVPQNLDEYTLWPSTSVEVMVPKCDLVNDQPVLPTNPGPGFSTDSCIAGLVSTDGIPGYLDNGRDLCTVSDVVCDYDFDKGYIDLLVEGTGLDPGYHGR